MLLEETLTIPLRILFALMVIGLVVGLLSWDAKVNGAYARTVALDAYLQQITNEATSSTAMFVPPSDPVDGSANADGHAFAFLQRDAQRNDHFLIYRFDAATHALQRYASDAIGGTPRAAGAPYEGIAWLHIALAHAHELDAPWFTRPVADQEFAMGYPGVVAGNVRLKGTIVDTNGSWRDLRFFSGTNPSMMRIVTAVYTPAPDPIVATPATLALDPGDTASLGITESNARYYTGSFFVAPQSGCGNVVSLAGPTHGATPLAPSTLAVTATGSGACTLRITDQVANPPLDVPVQVRGPVVVDPSQLTYHGTHDANPLGTHPDGTTFTDAGGTVQITQGYGGPFVATPGAGCGTVLGIAQPINVPGPAGTLPPFQPLAIGTCTFTIATTVGHAAPAQLVVQVLPATLVVTPPTITIAHQTDTATTDVSVSETDYPGSFDIDANDCTSRHVATTANAAGIANPGTFSVAADPLLKGGNATCTIAVFDQATNPEGSTGAKTVTVTVGDAVCTQNGDPKDAPMTVNGLAYISTGISCGQYDYILAGSPALPGFNNTPSSAADQSALAACQAAGQPVCALPDGTYSCTPGNGFSLADCNLIQLGAPSSVVTTGNQGAQAYPGSCILGNDNTCQPILAGNAGGGAGTVAPPPPVLNPTLVDVFSADAEQTWSNCFISSSTSQYPPDPNAVQIFTFDKAAWPASARLASTTGNVAGASAICPTWAPN
jgi:hypothetical protein